MTLLGNPPDDPITSLPIPGPMPSSCVSCPSRNPAMRTVLNFILFQRVASAENDIDWEKKPFHYRNPKK